MEGWWQEAPEESQAAGACREQDKGEGAIEGEDGGLHKGQREEPLQVVRGWHSHQDV